MRILHVTSALVGGGAETQLKLLMRGLADRGHDVGVVYLYDDPSFNQRDGIRCVQIERGGKKDLCGLYRRIATGINDFNPTVVHTWLPEIMTLPAALHARRVDIPCLSAQRRSLRESLPFKDRMRDWTIALNHALATRTVCNFSFEREPLLLRTIIERRKGVVVRNAFQSPDVTATVNPSWLREHSLKLIFVGRLVAQKRVELLLQAAAKLRDDGIDVQVGLYGQGTKEGELKSLAHGLGLIEGESVAFFGYQPDWQAAAKAYDLFVFPTVAEGMPNVLVEAMGLGLPTLATNIFEISSFIQHGEESWLVEPDSAVALYQGISKLQANQTLCESLALNGQKLADSLSVDHMVESYVRLYEEMLQT